MSDAVKLSDELQQSVDKFKTAKEDIIPLTQGLSTEQFNWRPSEKQWSVGECIEHLNQTGFSLGEALNAGIDSAYMAGDTSEGPFQYSWFGNWFANAAGVQRNPNKGKVKAPKLYVPSRSELDPTETIQRFQDLQDFLIEITQKAQGLDLKKVKVTSPAVKIVRLSLGVWLKMLPDHQRRHFDQAKRVKDDIF